MSDVERADPGSLLRSAERPRALTESEFARILARVDAESVTTEVIELDRELNERRAGNRFRRLLAPVVAGAAAVTLLFVMLTARDATAPEPVVPLSVAPSMPVSSFCGDHVAPIVDALVRWRGVENWAWADGEPDVGTLVGNALSQAGGASNVDADLLRDELSAVDESELDQRGAAAARTSAVDAALDALVASTSRTFPSCDVSAIGNAR
jgi:hypothetical protein